MSYFGQRCAGNAVTSTSASGARILFMAVSGALTLRRLLKKKRLLAIVGGPISGSGGLRALPPADMPAPRFAIAASPQSPIHGKIIQVLNQLPALRSALVGTVQVGDVEVCMPVHQSDILDYIWTLIDHVPINLLPPCASFIAGTEAGVAPPRVNFTAFMPLLEALGAVRAFLSNQSEETPPIIHP